MAGSGRDEPRPTDGGVMPGRAAEQRRLAEALRANLERRKTQKRVRLDRETGQERDEEKRAPAFRGDQAYADCASLSADPAPNPLNRSRS
jgi:hypothetical protein